MIDEAGIKLRYEALKPLLDERSRRRFAAAEALSLEVVTARDGALVLQAASRPGESQ